MVGLEVLMEVGGGDSQITPSTGRKTKQTANRQTPEIAIPPAEIARVGVSSDTQMKYYESLLERKLRTMYFDTLQRSWDFESIMLDDLRLLENSLEPHMTLALANVAAKLKLGRQAAPAVTQYITEYCRRSNHELGFLRQLSEQFFLLSAAGLALYGKRFQVTYLTPAGICTLFKQWFGYEAFTLEDTIRGMDEIKRGLNEIVTCNQLLGDQVAPMPKPLQFSKRLRTMALSYLSSNFFDKVRWFRYFDTLRDEHEMISLFLELMIEHHELPPSVTARTLDFLTVYADSLSPEHMNDPVLYLRLLLCCYATVAQLSLGNVEYSRRQAKIKLPKKLMTICEMVEQDVETFQEDLTFVVPWEKLDWFEEIIRGNDCQMLDRLKLKGLSDAAAQADRTAMEKFASHIISSSAMMLSSTKVRVELRHFAERTTDSAMLIRGFACAALRDRDLDDEMEIVSNTHDLLERLIQMLPPRARDLPLFVVLAATLVAKPRRDVTLSMVEGAGCTMGAYHELLHLVSSRLPKYTRAVWLVERESLKPPAGKFSLLPYYETVYKLQKTIRWCVFYQELRETFTWNATLSHDTVSLFHNFWKVIFFATTAPIHPKLIHTALGIVRTAITERIDQALEYTAAALILSNFLLSGYSTAPKPLIQAVAAPLAAVYGSEGMGILHDCYCEIVKESLSDWCAKRNQEITEEMLTYVKDRYFDKVDWEIQNHHEKVHHKHVIIQDPLQGPSLTKDDVPFNLDTIKSMM